MEKIDKLIEKAQKEYADALGVLREIERKLEELFRKKYKR